ncbi:MAG: acyltransferase family protein, partial [Schwartzia sp.]|nr:acyltransferase family protein [Schwartzia sp. (in: firmicutes)]MBR1885644.1 acyltransferase family protein [Schwartzia sp. (in: firmicutes)]
SICYIVWSIFYALAIPFIKYIVNPEYIISYQKVIAHIITGAFHMWFIPMIIGLYMIIPLLKPITKDKDLTEYFLVLSFIFAFIFPQIVHLFEDFSGGLLLLGIQRINKVILTMNMHFVLGFSFYFVLGYYLNTYEVRLEMRKKLYLLGILGFFLTVFLNAIIAWKTGVPTGKYFGNHTVNVALEAISIFIVFKYSKFENYHRNNFIVKISKYTFGAYWIHIFVRDGIHFIGINNLLISPLIAVPLMSCAVICISFACSFLLNKNSFANKWLV